MNEQRLISIETKIAFQEQIAEQLGEVLREQQQQIDQLRQTCQMLGKRLDSLRTESETDDPVDEKPPHY
jgi:SlyX protein